MNVHPGDIATIIPSPDSPGVVVGTFLTFPGQLSDAPIRGDCLNSGDLVTVMAVLPTEFYSHVKWALVMCRLGIVWIDTRYLVTC